MRKILATVGIALSLVTLTGCSSQTQAKVLTCTGLAAKPSEFTPYCADAGQVFTKIKWDSWQGDKATGSATVVTNLCEPTCAAGKLNKTSAKIELYKPMTVGGEPVFSKLSVSFAAKIPGYNQHQTVDLPTKPLGK